MDSFKITFMIIVEPSHKKFVFFGLNQTDYAQQTQGYAKYKRYGLRGIYSFASGAGVLGIVKDVTKESVINYSKRKFAAIVVNGALYVCCPAVIVFTNATKVVKWAARVHSFSSFVFKCVKDSGNLVFLPFDMLLFGQTIFVGDSDRFNLFGNGTDLFS